MTTIGSRSVNEIFQGIAPHPMILPFMFKEGQNRLVQFMRTDHPHFHRDSRFDAYLFLLGFHERL